MIGPTLKKLTFRDYDGAEEWFRDFLEDLNPFLADTTQGFAAVDKQITKISIFTDSTLAITFAAGKVRIKNLLPVPPTEVRIGSVVATTAGDVITSGVSVVWHPIAGNLISIDYITGLNTGGKTYDITLIVE